MRHALLCLVATFGLSANVSAEPEAVYRVVSPACQPQKPRFPAAYAKLAALRAAGKSERTHDVDLAVKDAQANLNVEATVHEIDLDADGVCDDVVVVLDPIGTGGDADALTTFYIAGKNGWKRIGARSAASDRPVDLDLIKAPADQDFAFSDFAVMRRADQPRTFIVAWRHDRITNGFAGYRIFELDPHALALRAVDKWNDEGARIYADFKLAHDADGALLYEPDRESAELRGLCTAASNSPGLSVACGRLKR